MTCISIHHYITGFNHQDDSTPEVFRKSQKVIEKALKAAVICGGFHLYKKVKHFASPNLISVCDPYISEADCVPVNRFTLPSVAMSEQFNASCSGDPAMVWRSLKDQYASWVRTAYPSMEIYTDIRCEEEVVCARIWAIDIECVDYSMQTLRFINKEDANAAVEMIRSVM